MAEIRRLTVESSYCKNWTVVDALRELIQNALDTKTKVTFNNCGSKLWEIRDRGQGLKLTDFLIGRSSKQSNDGVIGQFGEGAPIGCLVLARNNRKVTVQSLGKQYSFSLQYDNQWETDLLTISIDTCDTGRGTGVFVECSEEEINSAKHLFMKLNPPLVLHKVRASTFKADILDCPKIIYVNGLVVTQVDSMFGYNFYDKSLVNRDRAAIGYDAVRGQVEATLSNLTNQYLIEKLLKSAVGNSDSSFIEFNVNFNPRRNVWLRVIRECFGDRVCLSSNPKDDLRATEDNWSVLKVPLNFCFSLDFILPYSTKVGGKDKKIIPQKDLSISEKTLLARGKAIADEVAKEVGLDTFPIKIFEDTISQDIKRFDWRGYYHNGTVGVAWELLKTGSISDVVKTILHEYIHGTNGHEDNSRAFENDLCDVIATLALTWIAEKNNKARWSGLNYALRDMS